MGGLGCSGVQSWVPPHGGCPGFQVAIMIARLIQGFTESHRRRGSTPLRKQCSTFCRARFINKNLNDHLYWTFSQHCGLCTVCIASVDFCIIHDQLVEIHIRNEWYILLSGWLPAHYKQIKGSLSSWPKGIHWDILGNMLIWYQLYLLNEYYATTFSWLGWLNTHPLERGGGGQICVISNIIVYSSLP